MAPSDTHCETASKNHSPSLYCVSNHSHPHPQNPISTIHNLNFKSLPFHHPRLDSGPSYIFRVCIALLSRYRHIRACARFIMLYQESKRILSSHGRTSSTISHVPK
ncbi:hypothetical protein L873DRAFT_1069467 [Choiromyces venosus 120613-1]|uniref:Uncharacterized protein n=1 Tax=Choiromyces venosus 120613-1 TaxID=1336337 RepID=A0A3N4K636_9PEZI|nr:hypothetical protein L873DRAFT_1069467 [Choiromyces venosus 120613-1]